MNKQQEEHYSRQIKLPSMGIQGQEKLLSSRALIIGMGGLGSPAAMYLASAGVGHLVISDYDRIEESNLQRQIVHRMDDIGELKAVSAKKNLLSLNPNIEVTAIDWELDDKELEEQIKQADIVLDCSDNYPTRYSVNRHCVALKTPLVSGAAIRMEGQIASYIPSHSESPCYQCLYGSDLENAATCSEEGVISPLVGIIGSMQAMQALLILIDQYEPLIGKLLLFDARYMEWQTAKVGKNKNCTACGTH